MELKPIKLVSSGCYLPKEISSEEIEKKYNLAAGYAAKFSGVKSRHHATHESNGWMGARALERALEKGGLALSQIDLLISAGGTYDYPLPNQASIIKAELKDGSKYTFGTVDIDCTCLSFITAFDVAAKFLDGEQYKTIAIVSSEIASKGLNPANKETVSLFGDAAVAIIVSYDTTQQHGIIKGDIKTYAEGSEYTIIKGGGNKFFFKDYPYEPNLHSFHMEGIKLLKLAKKRIPDFMSDFFSSIPVQISDITWALPHQASKSGLEIFYNLYPEIRKKSLNNLENRGNCIAASVPLLLHENIENGTIKRGDILFLTGTSAGFSIGGCLLKY
jgi:3-oxoacyl-[acyl-carrier-protein] synthase-3